MIGLRQWSFGSRLTARVAMLGRDLAHEQKQEALQRLSHGLARHIVGPWPEITLADPTDADRAALLQLLMLMVVNPGIQAYVLDAQGRVKACIGEPGILRVQQVALQPEHDSFGRRTAAAAQH